MFKFLTASMLCFVFLMTPNPILASEDGEQEEVSATDEISSEGEQTQPRHSRKMAAVGQMAGIAASMAQRHIANGGSILPHHMMGSSHGTHGKTHKEGKVKKDKANKVPKEGKVKKDKANKVPKEGKVKKDKANKPKKDKANKPKKDKANKPKKAKKSKK